ncbi:DUF3991 domain-containing protein [Bacillus sp. Xin]|uniref:DUF3991 and TOPRIM domain-containing protein n=1 Tax=unclassified Bacillus (in: firmicutes) TaxID=185979 RepID=UPI001573904C|nr:MULTISPECIES: DUF3991 and TOPRIM domain-containing protein [unclassified Bacillus (in: firmicutes)]MBC6976073.1 DUF3991 domain-containing protein [Bacillus sp. Xin]NSW39055.1 DUF3991 domain-containing protein [Bacillus sp. Xin1]
MAHVSTEDSMKARNVDLISYLEAKGERFKKEGNYYRHTEHDSLIIKGNQYAWNSRGEKGYGAISFAMMYYEMTFPQAVMDINKGDYKEFDRSKAEEERKKGQQPFIYPKNLELKKQTEIKEYLIDERKIDPRLVNWLIKKDLIAQDKRNNVVFKWREEGGKGKIIGMNRQGTVKMENKRGSFKQIVPNYERIHAGFTVDVGKPDKIYFYEDPIDMLSHWSIKQNQIQNARLVSMHGLKPKTVIQSLIDAKKEGHDIKEVIMAVDNDKGGKEFIQTMKCLVDLKEEIPTHEKDWNDVRKKQVSQQNQQSKESAQPKQPKKLNPIREVERSV